GASGSVSTPNPTSTATAQSQQPDSTPYVPTTIRPEEQLPTTTPELVAELAKRAQAVGKALDQGDLTGLWYPAIGAKDVALALEGNHLSELPEDKRPKMASAVKRLPRAAWEIEAAGDLGNKDRLLPLYRDFSAAVADIESIYGSRETIQPPGGTERRNRASDRFFPRGHTAHPRAYAGDVEIRLQQRRLPAFPGSLRRLPRRRRARTDVARDVQGRDAVGSVAPRRTHRGAHAAVAGRSYQSAD